MAQLIKGNNGRANVLAYTAPDDMILRIETISFSVETGGESGPHYAVVGLGDSIEPVVTQAVCVDGAAPTTSVWFSFGVGYVNAAIKDGSSNLKEATAALPQLELFPGGRVQIAMNQQSGTSAPNDSIFNVFIYADLIRVDDGTAYGVPPLIPGLLYG